MASASKRIMIVVMKNRRKTAVGVQHVFTDFGCFIRTRIGLHDDVMERCSNSGLILLDLAGAKAEHRKLAGKLNAIAGVKAKLVEVEF